MLRCVVRARLIELWAEDHICADAFYLRAPHAPIGEKCLISWVVPYLEEAARCPDTAEDIFQGLNEAEELVR